MERAIESSSFKYSQFKKQVDIISNGANPNRTLCVFSRKIQLALKYAFKEKKPAIEEQEQLPSELFPFKKATFKIVIVQQVPEKITSQRSTLLKARVGYQKDDTSTSCY